MRCAYVRYGAVWRGLVWAAVTLAEFHPIYLESQCPKIFRLHPLHCCRPSLCEISRKFQWKRNEKHLLKNWSEADNSVSSLSEKCEKPHETLVKNNLWIYQSFCLSFPAKIMFWISNELTVKTIFREQLYKDNDKKLIIRYKFLEISKKNQRKFYLCAAFELNNLGIIWCDTIFSPASLPQI